MIQARHFATTPGANIIEMGDKKIMWGKATIQSVPNDQDKTITVTFPETFGSIPTVAATCAGWMAIRGVFATDIGKGSMKLGAHHIQGTTLNVPIDWLAIG